MILILAKNTCKENKPITKNTEEIFINKDNSYLRLKKIKLEYRASKNRLLSDDLA